MIVVTVPGLAGRHDVRTISASVSDIGGVGALWVDLARKTVTVDGDVSAAAIGAAIVAAGYTVGDGAPTPGGT